MSQSRRTAVIVWALAWIYAAPCAWATLPPVTNFAKVQASTGYNSVATSIVLLSGHGAKLPTTFPFPLVWWNCTDYGAPEDDATVEIISVTAKTSDTLTVVRAQESTAAANHNTGGKTYCMVLAITKGMWDAVRTDIAASGGAASMITSGTGSPEGVLTKSPGNLYLRTDGGTFGTLYIKETGTGNTGWVERSIVNYASPGAIGATTPNAGEFTSLKTQEFRVTDFPATYGPTVEINAAYGSVAVITATNAVPFLIENPLNAVYGQYLSVEVRNTSGGILGTITWDTAYRMAAFPKPGNGKRRTVMFRFNALTWDEQWCSREITNP